MSALPDSPVRARANSTVLYRNYVLGLILLGFTLNFFDRQVLNVVLPAIKTDLQVSDTALGFLSGFAFAILYVTLGLPIAWLADRHPRRALLALSVGVWAVMTVLCGLARNFMQLTLARFGVGVGEAGFTPAAFSLLADYFPPRHRAKAISIASVGTSLGVMAAFTLGGLAVHAYGWRATFLLAGTPGLLYALLFWFTVREPMRGMSDEALISTASTSHVSFLEAARALWRNRTYRLLVLGNSASCFGLYGFGAWLPSFLVRSHGLGLKEAGLLLGPLLGIGGAIGSLAGGYLVDRFGASDARWSFWVPAAGAAMTVPILVAALLVSGGFSSAWLYALAYLTGLFYAGPTTALVQALVSPGMRATATGWLLFTVNLLGLSLGPLCIGALSDMLMEPTGREGLRYAMILCAGVYGISALLYVRATRTLRADLWAGAAREGAKGDNSRVE